MRVTGKLLSVPVGDAVIGRVIDPLGNPRDGKGDVISDHRWPVEIIAPGVAERPFHSLSPPALAALKDHATIGVSSTMVLVIP